MLHLTICQLDLLDETKLNAAKSMMKELENEFQQIGQDLQIAFKGLKTSDYINPSSAQALFAEIDSSKSNKDGVDALKKIIHRLIEECLERDILKKEHLGKSFISFDNNSKMYVNKKLNVALIQVHKQKKFNAGQIIKHYGDSNIFTPDSSGKIPISQIHLSSKSQYENQDGSKRMDKQLFGNLL